MKLNEVKFAMRDKHLIEYNGGEYYISACIMRLLHNELYYQLELHSTQANSIVIVDMEKVELGVKGGGG